MSRLTASHHRAGAPTPPRVDTWTPREMRPHPYGPRQEQAPIQQRPVRSIGRFFGDLPREVQKNARAFARIAGRMPRPQIIENVKIFERKAKYANYN
jgi:hypothetical protein